MKKITAVLLATLLGMFMVVGSAGAFWIEDIGVTPGFDWSPDSGVCYTVELGGHSGPDEFDVEAMYFKTYGSQARVSVVTKFPVGGVTLPPPDGREYFPGDIAFNFGGDGYNYGIETTGNFGVAGGLYNGSGLAWSDGSDFPTVYPVSIEGTPSFYGPASFQYARYGTSDHWIIEAFFSTEFFGTDWGRPFEISWTMSCGNDQINLPCNPIPEPASMMLLGTGLLGLVGFGKKKFFS